MARHQPLLVALGVGQQFFNANIYRWDWARQQEIFWQMAWRMPAIKRNTLLLTSVIPDMPLETDLSFTAAVNWIYAQDYSGGKLPLALLYTKARLGGAVLPELKLGQPVTVKAATAIKELVADPEKFVGKEVLVEGEIVEVCQNMGCWMNLRTRARPSR